MENPGINNSVDCSSPENEDSPYFQRPQPAIHTAKRKERPEEVDETQSTQQCNSSDKKCFNCARDRRKCVGTYPFTEDCDRCKKESWQCYPHDKEQRTIQPAEEKCYQCRQARRFCDGTYPFTQVCGTCQALKRKTCTAEAPENGLPKDQKCQRCCKSVSKCFGEPPFKNKCASCMKRGYRCYAQDMEVPKRIPKPEKCLYCRNHQLGCDDKKPCTKCVTRNVACNYKDGDVKWTYQTDPKEWKEPTFPTCNECVRWNGSHPSKTLTCDGKSPCNCCLEELDKATRDLTPNCTYRYENGVSKSIKLPGERAQALRMRTQWQGKLRRKAASQKYTTAEDEDLLPNNTGGKNDSQDDKGNDPSQEACASFSYPYPDKSSDHDGNDLNAGGESDKEHTTAEDEELLNEDLLPHNTGDEDDSQSYMTWSPSRESCASFSYPYPDDGSDHDRNDSDAGGESDNEHPDQDHDHDHDHRSDSRDDENSKPYNNENQKGATPRIDLLSSRSRCSISSLLGPSSPRSLESRLSQDVRTGRDPSSPDDQIERGDLDSSNQSKVPNPRDYDDEMCYRLVDEGGSQKRKRSGYGSIGGFREAFGRRRL